MIMGDKNSNGIQFSKLIIVFAFILSIVGCATAIFVPMENMVAMSLMGVSGTLVVTAVVWGLKKSQTENVVKIYMGAYREIFEMKKESNSEDGEELCNNLENDMLDKINTTINTALDDATSLIEKQDVSL